MNELIDTNVILRFLVGDNIEQTRQTKKIFEEAEKGKRNIIVKPIVIAEACFVLESFYKQSRDEIASAMEVFLSQKWLDVEDRPALLSLWSMYRKNLHFVDSYLLACCTNGKSKILSFDKSLVKRQNTDEK